MSVPISRKRTGSNPNPKGSDPPSWLFGKLLQEASELKEAIRLERVRNADTDLSTVGQHEPDISVLNPVMNVKSRKTLKGNQGKILHFSWSADRKHIVMGGQEGHAVVWNAFLANKEYLVKTSSPWVTTCSYAPSTTLVACGGLDNQCTVYKLEGHVSSANSSAMTRISEPQKVVAQHNKYITYCSFLQSDQQLLSASADSTCALWDVEKKDPVQKFLGHKMEVMGLSINPKDPFSIFASGGADRQVCVWDVRSGECVMKFGHDSDVNAVRFFPTGDSVCSATLDGSLHLFDLRADQQVKFYTKPSIIFGATSLDFSKSGKLLFAGYDDYSIRVWDVLKGKQLTLWLNHQDRVTHVEMSPDGMALASSSWDETIRIWA